MTVDLAELDALEVDGREIMDVQGLAANRIDSRTPDLRARPSAVGRLRWRA